MVNRKYKRDIERFAFTLNTVLTVVRHRVWNSTAKVKQLGGTVLVLEGKADSENPNVERNGSSVS